MLTSVYSSNPPFHQTPEDLDIKTKVRLHYLACGLGCSGCYCGPGIAVDISLLNDVVGDINTTAVQRRLPGDHHVLPVHLIKHYRAYRRSWAICREKKRTKNDEGPCPGISKSLHYSGIYFLTNSAPIFCELNAWHSYSS